MVEDPTEETSAVPRWKIPPQKILSDDCVVYVGRVIEDDEITDPGTAYKVHEGEYVELFPCRSLKEIILLNELAESSNLRALSEELAKRVLAWNWTGMDYEPYPQPHNSPETIQDLTDDEFAWLLQAVKGKETSAARKNA